MKITGAVLASILAATDATSGVLAAEFSGSLVGRAGLEGRSLLTRYIAKKHPNQKFDALGDLITPHYQGLGHPNDGNEGNEGNEGDEGHYQPAPTNSNHQAKAVSPPPSGNGRQYDARGDEITKWYIRPGHPNDGNEGNEGNEGHDKPAPSNNNQQVKAVSPPPSDNGRQYDARGDEITKWYIRPGHPNDGNEGNEGNEGNDGNQNTPPAAKKSVPTPAPIKAAAQQAPSPPPAQKKTTPAPAAAKKSSPPPSPPSSGNDRAQASYWSGYRYDVCVRKDRSFTDFGITDAVNRWWPEGIRVFSDGRCQIMENAGGFDGYWSVDAGDGHEDNFANAVRLMLRDNTAIIGTRAGKNNPKNARVNKFMKELRDLSDPLDMDYPRDKALADNGKRMENINKASAWCTKMIRVRKC